MLKIKDLTVSINEKIILKNFNLNIENSKVYAIMGPNGVGKSTLSRVIMGDKNYHIVSGDILFNENSILKLTTDARSRLGIFLAMQYPMEIDGITNQDFLKTALSSKENKPVGLYDFIIKCETECQNLKMDKSLIHRSLNVGFSGGEKKKNEVLQIKLLKPKLIILDELDSGLDIDSLKIVSKNINDYKKENPDTSIIIITHHQKLLDYIHPDNVIVMGNGKILKTGDYNLSKEIEENGYEKYMTNIITEDCKNE